METSCGLCGQIVSALKTGLSTLPDNPGDSRIWTEPPGLQIRVSNLPDNHRSFPFLVRPDFHNNKTLNIWIFSDYFTVNVANKIKTFPRKLQQPVVLASVATVI